MLIHEMRRAHVSKEMIEKFDMILAGLPTGYKRALFPARQSFLEVLGIEYHDSQAETQDTFASGNSVVRKAELIITAQHVFTVEMIQNPSMTEGPAGKKPPADNFVLDLDCYGPDLNSQELQEFIEFLNEKFSVAMEAHYYPNRRMEELKAEGRVPPPMPTVEEIKASRVLSDLASRNLAIAIRKAGGLLSGDLPRQLPAAEKSRAEVIRKSLEESGLLKSETVVICKKTGSQVIIVPAATAVSSLATSGLKCPCGTAIEDEEVDSAFSITDEGRRLLDGNHWFTILLVDYLLRFGVPVKDVLVEQVSGGDEMDCIAAIEGKVVLFELKAKEFNLGNAYSFGAKIGIIEPDYPVIVTTHHVGADAREHFARARRRRPPRASFGRITHIFYEDKHSEPNVIYLEGIDSLHDGLMYLIEKITMDRFSELVPQLSFAATLSTRAIEQAVRERYSTKPAL